MRPDPVKRPVFKRASKAHLRAAVNPKWGPHVVWYRLHAFTDLMSRPFLSKYAKPYHLSVNDWRILSAVAHMPGTASHELARISGMTPMNVSRAVAALRKRGRLHETPDPTNRVRKHLSLTEEGFALYNELLPSVKSASKFVTSSMTQGEIATLTRLVEKLIARLEELNGIR